MPGRWYEWLSSVSFLGSCDAATIGSTSAVRLTVMQMYGRFPRSTIPDNVDGL
jgi:hypothetical protein